MSQDGAEWRCSGCRLATSETVFYRNRARPSGWSNYCKACENDRQREAYERDPAGFRARRNRWKRTARAKVIAQLGGVCVCCGESQYEFLQFDHVNNDGAEHRRQLGRKGLNLADVTQNPAAFQILCCNCNFAKGMHGRCPHQPAPEPLTWKALHS